MGILKTSVQESIDHQKGRLEDIRRRSRDEEEKERSMSRQLQSMQVG